MKRMAMQRLLGGALLIVAAGMTARAQWVQTNGTQGAMVATVVADDARIIVGAYKDIYHNVNGAWTKVGSLDAMGGFYTSQGGELLVKVGGVLMASTPQGLCRSTDLGASWAKVAEAGMLAADGGSFYAVRDGMLQRSADGAAWTTLGAYPQYGGEPVRFGAALVTSEGMQGGLFRSLDDGATWEPLANDLPEGGWGGRLIASGGSAIYATRPGSFGLFKSTDGAHWTDITGDMPEGAFITRIIARGDEVWAGTSEGLFHLTGSSWMKVSVPHVNAMAPVGDGLVAGTVSGIYRIEGSRADVRSLNNGLVRGSAAAMGSVGDAVVANTNDGIYRSLDGGANWERVADFYSYEFVEHRGLIYAHGDGFLYGSDNQGARWRKLGPYWAFEVEGDPTRSDLTGLAAYDGVLYLGAGSWNSIEGGASWSTGGMFRSTNNGVTWSQITNGLPVDCATEVPVGDVVAGEGYVLIATAAGPYRSTDRGESWSLSADGIGLDNWYFNSATMFKLGARVYYIDGKLGMFQSDDGGRRWGPMTPAIPDGFTLSSLRSVVDDQLYVDAYRFDMSTASTERRLYVFDGTTWKDITASEPKGVQFQGFTKSKGMLYAGSQEHGVWKSDDPTVVRAAGVHVTDRTSLSEAMTVAPTPATASAVVTFTLPSRSRATLTLVNALGEKVATIRDEMMEAGRHEEAIDTRGIAAGTYFVRLESAGSARVERLVKVE